MQWFTREYATGALDDDEWNRRRDDYQRHLASIANDLSGGAEELVAPTSFHDAQVRECGMEADGSFRLRVLSGDLQRGYEHMTLLYHDAELVGASLADFDRWHLDQAGVELIEDEVDVCGGDRYEHRLLFWPEGEFGIRFGGLTLTRRPATASDRR